MPSDLTPDVAKLREIAKSDAVETMRRVALSLCVYCGDEYERHDPSPQSACPHGCDHCHMSDFKCASVDDTTLIDETVIQKAYAAMKALPALLEAWERAKSAEGELRRFYWLGHGCPPASLYGDDGEMQCGQCGFDFKRAPLDEARARWFAARLAERFTGRSRRSTHGNTASSAQERRHAMSDGGGKKCPECGKARGGVCGACHCAPPHRGNHWYLFEAAQRSFCALHCRDGWHHAICRGMAEEIGDRPAEK